VTPEKALRKTWAERQELLGVRVSKSLSDTGTIARTNVTVYRRQTTAIING